MSNKETEQSRSQSPQDQSSADSVSVGQRLSLAGILFGISSAVSYTVSNACFREASTQVDFVFCAAAKAAITAVLIVPCWLFQGLRGVKILPGWKEILWLVFAGLQLQLTGGVMLQASLSTIGIALVVPIYLGAMVVTTAILSQFVLKENVSVGVLAALSVLILAVCLLSLGAETVHQNMEETKQLGTAGFSFTGGILAAVVVGISYSVLAVIIRGVFKSSEISSQTPIVFVSLIGLFVLAPWAFCRDCGPAMGDLSMTAWTSLLGGGVFNAMGFLFLTLAISALPVIYVNSINVSQAAMAALVGVLFFAEPATRYLWIGLTVMLVGFVLLSLARKSRLKRQVNASVSNAK